MQRLGDKLTAFAPKTTGILYSKNRPVEVIKQLFDIAFLFDNIENLDIVHGSYSKVVEEEIGFRQLNVNEADVLKDTFEACHALALRDPKSDELPPSILSHITSEVKFKIEKLFWMDAQTFGNRYNGFHGRAVLAVESSINLFLFDVA